MHKSLHSIAILVSNLTWLPIQLERERQHSNNNNCSECFPQPFDCDCSLPNSGCLQIDIILLYDTPCVYSICRESDIERVTMLNHCMGYFHNTYIYSIHTLQGMSLEICLQCIRFSHPRQNFNQIGYLHIFLKIMRYFGGGNNRWVFTNYQTIHPVLVSQGE